MNATYAIYAAMDLLLYLALSYILGFVLLAFLPGWRSLTIGAVFALAFGIWELFVQERGDGLGAAFARIMLHILALGLFAGFLARVVVLLSPHSFLRSERSLIILPLVFFVVPAIWFGLAWLRIV